MCITILYKCRRDENFGELVTRLQSLLNDQGISTIVRDGGRKLITPFAEIIVFRHGGQPLGYIADEMFGDWTVEEIMGRLNKPYSDKFQGNIMQYMSKLKRKYEVKTWKSPIHISPTVIKKVIFNPPATIVLWEDGTKTVVKAQDEDFDPEKGLAMAISKKALGNKGNYCNEIKKWTEPYYEEENMCDSFLSWMEENIRPIKNLGISTELTFTMSPDSVNIEKLKTLGDSPDTVTFSAVVDEIRRFQEADKPNPVQKVYDIMVAFRDEDKSWDLDEVIGYLGEALDN